MKKQKLPRALTEGLKPARIGLLRPDYEKAIQRAALRREAEISRKLEVLLQWYGIANGPDCWRALAIAMAQERFPGFREKSGRKPPKWTMGVLWMLAGEMRREMDRAARTQEEAAKQLASREPWKSFLAKGQWRNRKDGEPWQNLLYQYTRMPRHFRSVGTDSYLLHAQGRTLRTWDSHVRDFLRRPA